MLVEVVAVAEVVDPCAGGDSVSRPCDVAVEDGTCVTEVELEIEALLATGFRVKSVGLYPS